MNKQDTKQIIIDTFIKMYAKKDINEISVNELAKQANIYRGTFYYYFKDINDVLATAFTQLKEGIQPHVMTLINLVITNKNDQQAFLEFEKYIQDNLLMLQTLMITRENPMFIKKIKKEVLSIISNKLGNDLNNSLNNRYIIEYVTSAQLNLWMYWLANNTPTPLIELVELMYELNNKGPITL